jgi:phosphatidylglycerophosphate synthase
MRFSARSRIRATAYLDRLINRRLSRRLTCLLLRTPLTPNHVTVIGVVIGIAGGLLLGSPSTTGVIAGIAALLVSGVLDCCDGEIARIKFSESRIGHLLDITGDTLVHGALLGGIAMQLARTGAWPGTTTLVALGSSASSARSPRSRGASRPRRDGHRAGPVWENLVLEGVLSPLTTRDWYVFPILSPSSDDWTRSYRRRRGARRSSGSRCGARVASATQVGVLSPHGRVATHRSPLLRLHLAERLPRVDPAAGARRAVRLRDRARARPVRRPPRSVRSARPGGSAGEDAMDDAEQPPEGRAPRRCARATRVPSVHPLLALRVSSLALEPSARWALVDALFRAVWANGLHVSDAAVIERVATGGRGSTARPSWRRRSTPTAKRGSASRPSAPIARGIFGVPTMEAGDEIFWGYDDFPHLELCMAGRDPLEPFRLGEVVGRSPPVRRSSADRVPMARGLPDRIET